MRTPAPFLTALIAAALLAATPAAAAGPASPILPRIEEQVMCVTCRIPLNTAFSPQADVERAYIRSLIRKNLTEPQIKRDLVAQYGPAVLATPAAEGFDLAAYLVPATVVAALLALVALLLPRWRRRARGDGAAAPDTSRRPSEADARRLEEDMARFDR